MPCGLVSGDRDSSAILNRHIESAIAPYDLYTPHTSVQSAVFTPPSALVPGWRSFGGLAVVRKAIPPIVVTGGARITRVSHPAIQVLAKATLCVRVLRTSGNVLQLVGVSAKVVQFLGGPLRRSQTEICRDRRILASVEHQRFRWPAIDVAERPDGYVFFRIPRRPPVRTEVPDVEKLLRPDGAHGIAQISAADVCVPLALYEDAVSVGLPFPPAAARARFGRSSPPADAVRPPPALSARCPSG